jgi:hypothetical protein
MKIGKTIIAAVAVTIFNAIVGMVTCGGIFSWVYKLEPTNVWKPMSGGPGVMFMVGSFVLSLILALVYALIQKGIPGGNKFVKGMVFGLCVWAVGMLPGMFATYAFMNIAATVVVYCTVLGLIKTPLEGMIISAIYGE